MLLRQCVRIDTWCLRSGEDPGISMVRHNAVIAQRRSKATRRLRVFDRLGEPACRVIAAMGDLFPGDLKRLG